MLFSNTLHSYVNIRTTRRILNTMNNHLFKKERCSTQCDREKKKKTECTNEGKKESKDKKCSSGKEKKFSSDKEKKCPSNKEKKFSSDKDKKNEGNMPRVGINGFGRIGRMVMRVATEHSCPIEIVAINDPKMTTELMAYLLKYDTTHGRFVGNVEVSEKNLLIEGKKICTYSEKEPKSIPWKDLKVDYVIEASGKFKSLKAAEEHVKSGAKKVVMTAGAEDVSTYILGANLDCYDPTCPVVSSGSCTTNALAPLVKVIHDSFQIEGAMMTTIHAVTMSQELLDSPVSKNWRIGRAAFQNSIPFTTGVPKAIGKILPDLKGKLTATSIRVPLPNVSIFDLTCRLGKQATMEQIESALCEAKDGPLLGILDVTSEQVVSSDFIGSPFSCTYDTNASLALNDKFVKLLAWYDNEYGYTCRVIDLIKFIHAEHQSNCQS